MAGEYRLVTYRDGKGPQAGLLVAERVYPTAKLIQGGGIDANSVLGLLQSWDAAHARLAKAAAEVRPADGTPLARSLCWRPFSIPAACSAPARITGTTPRRWPSARRQRAASRQGR